MMNPKRLGTWILGTAFVGTIVYYSFFQPFVPGAVCLAMLPESQPVYHAESLKEALESPVGNKLNSALGSGTSLDALLEGHAWAKFATPSEIAVADIPFRQIGKQKSWAAASWIGWRSPWLRWKLENSFDPNLHFIGKYNVWPYWRYDLPAIQHGLTLSISVTDNLFIACLSERPQDILYLLNAYDRATPSFTP